MASAPPPVQCAGSKGDDEFAAAARPAWAEVDLGALRSNFGTLRRRVAPTRVLAVVKADAYGHGAVETARVLEEEGADWLGVALVEEGIELRRAGVSAPTLVLGAQGESQLAAVEDNDLVPTICSPRLLDAWRQHLASPGPEQEVHLKIDTGMHRLGFQDGEWQEALEIVAGHSRLRLGGLLSHLGDSEEPESDRHSRQERRFAAVVEAARGLGLVDAKTLVHLAASSTAIYRPSTRHDLVRFGLALYGVDPVDRSRTATPGPDARGHEPGESRAPDGGVEPASPDLQPVLSVRAGIVRLLDVPAGEAVGYGGRSITHRRTRLGVVPVGYADGYTWSLAEQGEVLVDGRRAPLFGPVSMDMLGVDLTDREAGEGDVVTLLGTDGGQAISVVELAEWSRGSVWETLCRFSLRLPRRYVDGNRTVAVPSRR